MTCYCCNHSFKKGGRKGGRVGGQGERRERERREYVSDFQVQLLNAKDIQMV